MTRQELLALAADAVGARAENYCPPGESFSRIAALWSTILGIEVRMYEVALCMAALKIARLMSAPGHEDSWADLAGYAACGAEVAPAVPVTHRVADPPPEQCFCSTCQPGGAA